MKCWNCGNEIDGGMAFCAQCGAAANRMEPATKEGRALRTLMEHYGRDKVLMNSMYLTNGLADLMEDAEPLRTHLKLAMDAGLGQLILEQLRDNGAAPSNEFAEKATRLLIDKAGLSDMIAEGLLSYVDDMLGWRGEPAEKKTEIPYNAAAAQTAAPKAAPVQQPVMLQQPATAAQAQSSRGPVMLVVVGIIALLIMQATLERTTWEYALSKLLPQAVSTTLMRQPALNSMLMMLCGIVPAVLALAVPFMLGKGKKTEATVSAVVYTVFMAAMVGGIAGRKVLLGAFELPMLLFALLLVYCSMKDEAESWVEPALWTLTALCVVVFVILSFANIGSLNSPEFGWSTRAWMMKGWFQKIFMGGASYYMYGGALMKEPLTAFFPLHRALLVALTALLFRSYCKKQN